ncbi:LOW QUALITY PROTEIN: serine protease inhibitor A3K-like [Anableps anableps]
MHCIGRGQQQQEHAEEAQDTLADSGDNRISLVIFANKEFAFQLYKKLADLAASEGKNILFSPVSVSAALAALSVGARGETHQQLFSGLSVNSSQVDQMDVNQAFRTFIGNMVSHKELRQGTTVFVDNLLKPKPDFLHVLKQCYFTGSFNVDFMNPIESVNIINRYVSEKTNGKINQFEEGLDPNTVLYLLSYIYFRGKCLVWGLGAVFQKLGDSVLISMMRIEDDVDIYYDEAIATLHLPFNNSYSMLLLSHDHMDTLENNISPAHVTRWLECMKQRTYKISVPKFSIKTSYKLHDVLTKMGMADLFGAPADLSGIADGHKLVLSLCCKVVHQATLDVDETGATAAAGTDVGIILKSLSAPELKFNHPFVVIITERFAENLLFMGKIVNPNI